MRLIDADALEARMFHIAFETDTDLQKWDSGCWIRYKLFENILAEMPTIKNPVAKTEQHDNWILCTPDTMPEESMCVGAEELGTTISDEVFVTFEEPNGKRFVKQLRFHGGKLSAFDQYFMDIHHKGSIPIAWKPFLKPYQG